MSNSAEQIISELLVFSNHKIKNIDDLERIIDICLKNNKITLLDDTAFLSRFLQGLFSIIQRGESSLNEEVLKRYIEEYNENIEKVKINLREILSISGNFISQIFEEKYFALTQQSLSNLNDLCYDLGWYKMYRNDKNRKF